MKISESPYDMLESYVVKFWHTNDEGYYKQTEEIIYADCKNAHKAIEKYFVENVAKYYRNANIVSIIYQ